MGYYRSHYLRTRANLFLKTVPFFLLIGAAMIGAWQIKQVREFFGHASGELANIQIDTQAVIGPMPRPWRNIAQGGEESAWRMSGPVLSGLKAIHPEYIRLDHIYDFYNIVQGTPGNLTFDFSKLDLVLDDIKAVGAKPYIALSYMPPAISSGDILAVPVKWTDWQLVIQKTIEHVSGTRGISHVYYEVWNEPDLFGSWKMGGAKNYLTLYNYAALGAANARAVQPFKFGGPAITALYKNWFDGLAKFALANNLRFDFFSWHRYSKDITQYKKDMTDAQNWAQAYPQLQASLEYHITEWGQDSNNNPSYDNNVGAAHTVAGSIEMIGSVQRAFEFEVQDGKDPAGKNYWGRWGLFTNEAFGSSPKPRYYGLKMLDGIGNSRLQLLGKGSWVTGLAAQGDQGQTQLVLANYDPAGVHSENVPVTLNNITPGNYTITKQYLSGAKQTIQIATSSAALQFTVPMSANSVSFVEVNQVGGNVPKPVAPPIPLSPSSSTDITPAVIPPVAPAPPSAANQINPATL